MAEEPENIVLVLLRDIRAKVEAVDAKVEAVDAKVEAVDARVQRLEKQVEDLNVGLTYSLGQSTQTQFRQARQGARIDDLFARLEKVMTSEKPQ